jgi:hypothetical protein
MRKKTTAPRRRPYQPAPCPQGAACFDLDTLYDQFNVDGDVGATLARAFQHVVSDGKPWAQCLDAETMVAGMRFLARNPQAKVWDLGTECAHRGWTHLSFGEQQAYVLAHDFARAMLTRVVWGRN